MTTEPKRYTAKEAMHWMVDHPLEEMFIPWGSVRVSFRNYIFCEYCIIECRWIYTDDLHRHTFYIRTDYDAWQSALAAEKAQEDEKLPRVGESFQDWWMRQETHDWSFKVLQTWIDANFVRREGR